MTSAMAPKPLSPSFSPCKRFAAQPGVPDTHGATQR
jgi:hypothetical protein